MHVHSELGPGLTEKPYVYCLRAELEARGLTVLREVTVPITWRDVALAERLRVDLVAEGVPIEVKTVERLTELHEAQLRNYLRFLDREVGILLNFDVVHMRHGIVRVPNLRAHRSPRGPAVSVPQERPSPSYSVGGGQRRAAPSDL